MSRFHSLLSLGKHACHENTRKLDNALARLLEAPDTNAIHDVRVACRRLETALKITEPLYQNLEPLRKSVKRLQRELGDVRDVEVLAERAHAILPQAPTGRSTPATHPAIAGALLVAELLDAEAELGRVEAAATVSHSGATHLPKQIEKALHALGLHRGKLRRFPRLRLHQFACETLSEHLTAVQALDIRRSSSCEELHALRVAIKRLRYAAEFFSPGLPSRAIAQLTKLTQRYQQILGDLHDSDVALTKFRRWHAVHVKAKVDGKIQIPPAQRRYRLIQLGVTKLMEQARSEQKRVRAQFFKSWTARHQRELASLIAQIDSV